MAEIVQIHQPVLVQAGRPEENHLNLVELYSLGEVGPPSHWGETLATYLAEHADRALRAAKRLNTVGGSENYFVIDHNGHVIKA